MEKTMKFMTSVNKKFFAQTEFPGIGMSFIKACGKIFAIEVGRVKQKIPLSNNKIKLKISTRLLKPTQNAANTE
jgi:hypothetical protein